MVESVALCAIVNNYGLTIDITNTSSPFLVSNETSEQVGVFIWTL